ncbi:LOW QUALITY PROTEIN: hypothetical protein ColTof4_13594 [Colletotrichum tofieldiae]|nr:LOW QUALITY PROTEIN: hypothetical protein ColTof4_13594 [Colletotrichum tofieldiae]
MSAENVASLLAELGSWDEQSTTTNPLPAIVALYKQWWIYHQDDRRARASLDLNDAAMFLGRAVPLKTASTKTVAGLINSSTQRTFPVAEVLAAVRAAICARHKSPTAAPEHTSADITKAANSQSFFCGTCLLHTNLLDLNPLSDPSPPPVLELEDQQQQSPAASPSVSITWKTSAAGLSVVGNVNFPGMDAQSAECIFLVARFAALPAPPIFATGRVTAHAHSRAHDSIDF